MRIIDADYLEESLKDSCNSEFMAHAFVEFLNYVDDCPTIDAKPVVYGRWHRLHFVTEPFGYEMPDKYVCSECRSISYKEFNYCPDCGAKMKDIDEIERECQTCFHYDNGAGDIECTGCIDLCNWE